MWKVRIVPNKFWFKHRLFRV